MDNIPKKRKFSIDLQSSSNPKDFMRIDSQKRLRSENNQLDKKSWKKIITKQIMENNQDITQNQNEMKRPDLSLEEYCKLDDTCKILKKHNNNLEKLSKVLQEFYETEEKMMYSDISLKDIHNILQEYCNILQEHERVLQDLRKTEDKLRHPDPSLEEHENLQHTVWHLRLKDNYYTTWENHHETLQEFHETENKLRHPALSSEQHKNLQQTRENLQKYGELLKDLREWHQMLNIDLSQAKCVDWEKGYNERSEELSKQMAEWGERLAERIRNPKLPPRWHAAYLQIQSSISQEAAGKILEKRQQRLKYMQSLIYPSEREQKTLENIDKFSCSILDKILISKENADNLWCSNRLVELEQICEEWKGRFSSQENHLKMLEKYPEIRDKLQHTQAELTHPNLSDAKRANLQDSHWVLQRWKENLDSLADDSSPDNSRLGYDTQRIEKKISRMKLNETLEKLYSDLTDANRSQAEPANLQDSHWVLQMWKENLDLADPAAVHFDLGMRLSEALEKCYSDLTGSHLSQKERAKQEVSRKILSSWNGSLKEYAEKGSENQQKECQRWETYYNDWEADRLTWTQRQMIELRQKGRQYRESFVNACWEMLRKGRQYQESVLNALKDISE